MKPHSVSHVGRQPGASLSRALQPLFVSFVQNKPNEGFLHIIARLCGQLMSWAVTELNTWTHCCCSVTSGDKCGVFGHDGSFYNWVSIWIVMLVGRGEHILKAWSNYCCKATSHSISLNGWTQKKKQNKKTEKKVLVLDFLSHECLLLLWHKDISCSSLWRFHLKSNGLSAILISHGIMCIYLFKGNGAIT